MSVTHYAVGIESMQGIVEEIYITAEGGAPMERVDEVEAIAYSGLRGDRYMKREGYWSGVDECQVTLIERETLDQIALESEIRVAHGEHRRNIVTRGIRLHELRGKQFAIGDAILEYDRPRPPCGYIQSITQHGMTRALRGERGGICARVVKSGVIRANDVIRVL
jgi:MOSC domain-containing protein YiiM